MKNDFETTCYNCKKPLDSRHEFYPFMCPPCGDLNFKKRNQKADLTGYTALVTGARVKIGYYTALMLLRCGAQVIATTRFPADAERRFQEEEDFSAWKDRLAIYAIDLRDIISVNGFIEDIIESYDNLDILINNAAQTIRRPPVFYRHLLDEEQKASSGAEHLIKKVFDRSDISQRTDRALALLSGPSAKDESGTNLTTESIAATPAQMSQIPLLPSDKNVDEKHFPPGHFDHHGQQEDRRSTNSWMLELEEVPLLEFMEALSINLIAPFQFNTRLKPLLKKGDRPSFIINVSAMEGNFSNPEKSTRHPHTNMAKAALNMMTRTSAAHYATDRIYMNSVEVGWITNEKPFPLEMKRSERREKMAIDEIDGAARICDPIFSAINEDQFVYGSFLKNYQPFPW